MDPRFAFFLLIVYSSMGCTQLVVPDGGGGDGSIDSGPPDSVVIDSGSSDGSPIDTGPADSGLADTRPADTGPADTGPADTAVDTAAPPPPPMVTAVVGDTEAEPMMVIELECRVTWTGDPDALGFTWEVDDVAIAPTGQTLMWSAPLEEGDKTIRCIVTDTLGRTSAGATVVSVLVGRSVLTARYSFDSDAMDSSGNGHHGTVTGALYRDDRLAGGSGRALEFDGSDVVTIPHSAGLSLSQFTFTMWVRPATPDTSHRTILSKASAGFGNYNLRITDSAAMFWANYLSYTHDLTSGNWGTVASTSIIPNAAWVHLAVTVRADGTFEFYRNGVSERSAAGAPAPRQNTTAVRIGNSYAGAGFIGLIDEVRIYGVPLGDAEVAAIAASPY